MDDAPNRYHHEDSDNAPEHSLQTFMLLFANFPEIPDQAPEEHDDSNRYEKTYETVKEQRKNAQRAHDTLLSCRILSEDERR